MFHIRLNRIISIKEVRTPWPRSFQDLPTVASVTLAGASLNTCSAYLATNISSAASVLVKKSVLLPDNAWETASRFVPQATQNFRPSAFSLPQVGQNIHHRLPFYSSALSSCANSLISGSSSDNLTIRSNLKPNFSRTLIEL